MDLDELYQILPKNPLQWSLDEVGKWLEFISLESLKASFKDASIDGSCLYEISDDDLKNDLGVAQAIVRKKILNWIQTGLSEYKLRFDQPSSQSSLFQQSKVTVNDIQKQKPDQETLEKEREKIQDQLDSVIQKQKSITKKEEKEDNKQSYKDKQEVNSKEIELLSYENQLIITPYEGPQTNFYCLREKGGKLGRHSSNDILILEQSVSRYHAEIFFDQPQSLFYLRDVSSTSGTYIKIVQQTQLEENMTLEMGSYQFLVLQIEVSPKEFPVPNTHYDLPEHQENDDEPENSIVETTHNSQFSGVMLWELIQNQHTKEEKIMVKVPTLNSHLWNFTIGRKASCNLPFTNDQHISNMHSSITFHGNAFYIEDMGSTNGTWQRLSQEQNPSEPFVIENDTIFQVGTTSTFKCQYNQQKIDPIDENCCVICCKNDRDIVFMPCKHNTSCLACSQNLTECIICRIHIEEQIKIYQA